MKPLTAVHCEVNGYSFRGSNSAISSLPSFYMGVGERGVNSLKRVSSFLLEYPQVWKGLYYMYIQKQIGSNKNAYFVKMTEEHESVFRHLYQNVQCELICTHCSLFVVVNLTVA